MGALARCLHTTFFSTYSFIVSLKMRVETCILITRVYLLFYNMTQNNLHKGFPSAIAPL